MQMLQRLRVIATLLAAVALLAWAADSLVTRITTSWFDHDAAQRARLMVATANSAIADRWTAQDTVGLRQQLVDLAADEQILAVAACGNNDEPVARTERFPQAVTCAEAREQSGAESASAAKIVKVGEWRLTVRPITSGGASLGAVILVHDMRFADLRVAQIKTIVFGAFALFGIASLVFAFFDSRVVTQFRMREIAGVLGGFSRATEFRTLLGDLRRLAARATALTEARDEERAWTPARIKEVVHDALDGAQVIIMANREPIVHERKEDGSVRVLRPASGLVSALEPIIRTCSGVWVAHGSGSADRSVVDKHDRFIVPPKQESYVLKRVWLNRAEEQGYYYGFSNEGLWPLCHIAHARPVFRLSDFESYRTVNQRFVDAVHDESDRDDPVILVQDYHFALAPKLLRERMPDATIVSFWHIPWPSAERFSICPWGKELLDGMLGASIVGFHTQQHCNNFLESVDTHLEARIDRERAAVVRRGRTTLVRHYPISVEWPLRWLDAAPSVPECARIVRERLGLRPDALLGIGVDRLDYTKGLEERFLAVERLLETHPRLRGRFSFIQIAAPSREKIPRYREFADSLAKVAARINDRFGRGGYRPIILLHEHHDHESVVLHYRAADLCFVSSLHDGMNLVAKEFVSSRTDERGVLMLSQFTGSARELTEALIVNPYDIDDASEAMARALRMSEGEQRVRMRAMRTQVRENNVFRWAGRMLSDAAQERRRSHLASRLRLAPELELSV